MVDIAGLGWIEEDLSRFSAIVAQDLGHFQLQQLPNSRLCLKLSLNVVSQLSKTLSFSLPYCGLQSLLFCVQKRLCPEHPITVIDFHEKTWEFKTSILRCLTCLSGHYSRLTIIEDRIIWLCALGKLETWIDFFCPDRALGPVHVNQL